MPKPRAGARQRGYTTKWETERKRFLREHPLCVYCLQAKQHGRATNVDHIIPHRGDLKLFWRRSNWQGLCDRHHNSTKQAEEKAADANRGCDEMGNPLDPGHHWGKQ